MPTSPAREAVILGEEGHFAIPSCGVLAQRLCAQREQAITTELLKDPPKGIDFIYLVF